MKELNKVSEAEIEQKLIEDAEDPDAWEAPVTVLPIKASRPEWYRRIYHETHVKPEGMHKSIAKQEDKVIKRSKSEES